MSTTVTLPREDIPMAGGARPSRDWYRWAHDVTERIGGSVSTPTLPDLDDDLSAVENDLMQAPVSVVMVDNDLFNAPSSVVYVQGDDSGGELAALRAELNALRVRIESLEQGVSL